MLRLLMYSFLKCWDSQVWWWFVLIKRLILIAYSWAQHSLGLPNSSLKLPLQYYLYIFFTQPNSFNKIASLYVQFWCNKWVWMWWLYGTSVYFGGVCAVFCYYQAFKTWVPFDLTWSLLILYAIPVKWFLIVLDFLWLYNFIYWLHLFLGKVGLLKA